MTISPTLGEEPAHGGLAAAHRMPHDGGRLDQHAQTDFRKRLKPYHQIPAARDFLELTA